MVANMFYKANDSKYVKLLNYSNNYEKLLPFRSFDFNQLKFYLINYLLC
jgi:hypothetical protein